jgi:hypothetical protein
VQESVRECTLTLPRQLPLRELDSRWTPETLKNDCKGQKSSPRGFLYIIGKLLKCRCPKWACINHLDIYNISYGKKEGRESNWQFDSQSQRVRNRFDLLACKRRATHRWKALDEGYNFSLDLITIEGLHKKLWSRKVARVPIMTISRLPFGSLGKKKPFRCGPRVEA